MLTKLPAGSLALALLFGLRGLLGSSIANADAGGAPVVLAHRGGSGQWPQNSRTAVANTFRQMRTEQNSVGGIEFDLAITSDGVPILSHEPFMNPSLCTLTDGSSFDGQPLVKDLTLAEIQRDYRCGGLADEDFVDVEPVADTVMPFGELLEHAAQVPNAMLYLDLKIEDGKSAEREVFAKSIMSRLKASHLTSPIMIEVPDLAAADAFRAEGADSMNNVTLVLSYPPFVSTTSFTVTFLKRYLATVTGLRSPIRQAQKTDTEGVAMPTQLTSRTRASHLRKKGIQTVIYTPNTAEDLERYCSWPVDVLITDFPKLGPCPAQ